MTPDSPSTHGSVFHQMRDAATRDAGMARLLGRYKEYILGRCRARGLQDADAEDVTQLVLIKLGDRIEGYDPSRPFRPWLATVVRNAVEDHRRERAGREAAEGGSTAAELLAQAEDDGPDGEEGRELSLMAELVRRVEAEGRPDFQAFWLLHVAGWTTAEVAERLNRLPNNVSQMAFRGKRWARAMLTALAAERGGRTMSACPGHRLLWLHLNEQLSAEDAAEVAAHLDSGCAACEAALLRMDDEPAATVPGVNTTPPPGDAARGEVAGVLGYRIEGLLAKGGMGEVYLARDTRLRRPVALKTLREDCRGLERRFLEEARIAGQLQHPGIPPVHEVGTLPDGRPFFAMKLVRGRTLAELLAERPSPGHELARLLGTFEQVAQAVGYAHSRGVIHRDLKPANVMVGAFGEVQVMDWGLAKVIGSADDLVETDREGMETRAGAAMGTWPYMPPEQARGEAADEKSDVFGLGAILCEVLTGQPAYVGEGARERAAAGDVSEAYARLDGCGADAELVALAKACLAVDRAGRPADVAGRVAAYRAAVEERLRRAELGRAEAQVKAAEERKRRRVQMALAGSILLTLLLAGGGWAWNAQREAREKGRRDEVRREVGGLLTEAASRWAQGHAAEARGVAQGALARLEDAPDQELQGRGQLMLAEIDEREKDRLLSEQLEAAHLATTDVDPKNRAGKFAYERVVPKYRAAFDRYGWAVGRDDTEGLARALATKPVALREAMAATLDDWIRLADQVREPHADWLNALAEKLDRSGWATRVRRAVALPQAERSAAFTRLAAEADVAALPPATLHLLARRLIELNETSTALRFLQRARRQHPADFWLTHFHAMALVEKNPDEALRYLTAAVALRPGSAAVRTNLAISLAMKGELPEAVACFGEAIRLDPSIPSIHFNLGATYAKTRRFDDAIASFREAARLDDQFTEAHLRLGSLLLKVKGDHDGAIACFRKGTDLAPEQAEPWFNLAFALSQKGRKADAMAAYERAAALDPKDARALVALGDAFLEEGRIPQAIDRYERATRIDPKNLEAFMNLGTLLCDVKGEYDRAIACFERAIAVAPDQAGPRFNLGVALGKKGRADDAIAAYSAAVERDPRHAGALGNLVNALGRAGRTAEAVPRYEALLGIEPRNGAAHLGLGQALVSLGRFGPAEQRFRRALELLPAFHPLRPLASSHLAMSQRFQAMEAKLPSVLTGEARLSAPERAQYAQLCIQLGRPHAASRLFAESFLADPKLADDLNAAHRYNAACAAVLASRGQGDAEPLAPPERAELRKRSLAWLRRDLAAREGSLKGWWPGQADQTREMLRHWLTDPDLSAVRDVRKLPESERSAWHNFWVHVAQLARGPK